MALRMFPPPLAPSPYESDGALMVNSLKAEPGYPQFDTMRLLAILHQRLVKEYPDIRSMFAITDGITPQGMAEAITDHINGRGEAPSTYLLLAAFYVRLAETPQPTPEDSRDAPRSQTIEWVGVNGVRLLDASEGEMVRGKMLDAQQKAADARREEAERQAFDSRGAEQRDPADEVLFPSDKEAIESAAEAAADKTLRAQGHTLGLTCPKCRNGLCLFMRATLIG